MTWRRTGGEGGSGSGRKRMESRRGSTMKFGGWGGGIGHALRWCIEREQQSGRYRKERRICGGQGGKLVKRWGEKVQHTRERQKWWKDHSWGPGTDGWRPSDRRGGREGRSQTKSWSLSVFPAACIDDMWVHTNTVCWMLVVTLRATKQTKKKGPLLYLVGLKWAWQ